MQRILLALALCLALPPAFGAFSFSEDERQEKESEGNARKKVSQQLATPCREALKDRKIMVVIEKLSKFGGERHDFLTAGEYTQLTGRAGRRGIDKVGYAAILWNPFVPFEQAAGLAARRT